MRRGWFLRHGLAGAGLLLAVLAAVVSAWLGAARSREIRGRLVGEVEGLALALPVDVARRIDFTAGDQAAPAFQRLQGLLRSVSAPGEADPAGCTRRYYTLARHGGAYFFGPHGCREGFGGRSGRRLVDPPRALEAVFVEKRPAVAGPWRRGDDVSLSVYAPLLDNRGEVVMVLGRDLEAAAYRRAIAGARAAPLLGGALLGGALLFLLLWFVARWLGRQPDTVSRSRREVRLVLAGGLLLAMVVALVFDHAEAARREAHLRRVSQAAAAAVADELHESERRLAMLARFFHASEKVSREEFRLFARPVLERSMLQALAWLPEVPAGERAAYEAQARAAGLADFVFTDPDTRRPAGPRAVYRPVFYLESRTRFAAEVPGLDFGASALFEAALAAADGGLPAASGPVPLPGMTGHVFIFQPVDGSRQRGHVAGLVSPERLLFKTLRRAGLDRLLAAEVVVGASGGRTNDHRSADALLFAGAGPGAAVAWPLFFADRTFRLYLAPGPGFAAAYPRRDGVLALLAGLVVAGLLTLLAAGVARREGELSGRLAASERLLTAVTGNLPGAVFRGQADAEMKTFYISEGIERITGFPAADFIAGRVSQAGLVHPDDRPLLQTILVSAARDQASYDHLYRIHDARGRLRWVREIGRGNVDDEGRSCLDGLVLDHTEQKETEEALGRERERMVAIFDAIREIIYVADLETHEVLFANRFAREMIPGIVGGVCYRVLHGREEPCEFCQNARLLEKPGEAHQWQFYSARLGRHYLATDRLINWNGRRQVRFTLATDITAQKLSEEQYRLLIEHAHAAIALHEMVFDEAGRPVDYIFLSVNRAFERETGLRGADIVGRRVTEVLPGIEKTGFIETYGQVVRSGEPVNFERYSAPLGRHYFVSAYRMGEKCFATVFSDISERKDLEARLVHEATHDPLTGLSNRKVLLARLEKAIAHMSRKPAENFMLVFIDLDDFKKVNDNLGHGQGDELLRQAAGRLTGCLRQEDTLARLGGDEFAILLEQLPAAAHGERIVRRVLEALRRPFTLAGQPVHVSASLGVCLGESGQVNAEQYLANADMAMYRAKRAGKDRFAYADPALHEAAARRLHEENLMRRSLAENRFLIHYQPIVRLDGPATVVGQEALLRWQHPRRGLLMPGDFIALAEETGLIVPLGLWVLETACRQWQAAAKEGRLKRLHVNVTARQLFAEDVVEQLRGVLERTGFPPAALCLEITENSFLSLETEPLVRRIKQAGVQVFLDDFGTGFSSFDRLRSFPLDGIKIDRSFIVAMAGSEKDAGVVRAMVTIGCSLGMTVIAEGVETAAQAQQLKELGCPLAQGYFWGRPALASRPPGGGG